MRTTKAVLENTRRAANRLLIGWHRLLEDRLGQDLIEYALLAGFITVVIGAMLPSQVIPPLKQMWTLIAAPLNWAATESSS